MKKITVCFVLLSWIIGLLPLSAQKEYWLKIQPASGSVYHFSSKINISIENGSEAPVMASQMEQSIFSKITAVGAQEITLVEKVEKIKGSSTAMGQTFDFDTSNPMVGNPTLNAQMEQMVGKEVVSRIKPNGIYIGGSSSLESLMGGESNGSEFRVLTGNVRFPDYALKIGDSWMVVDTSFNQGMTNITKTIWSLQEIQNDLAILASSGTGTMVGIPPTLPDGKITGTLSTSGFAKIELSTGISREAALKIDAKMNLVYAGQTQALTSVTESVSKLVN